jgi:kynurenine formamidase
MKVKKIVVFILVIFFINCSNQTSKKSGEWIDLSYEFSEETIYWPTSDTFKFDTVAEGKTEKGYYYSAYKFCAAEHGGTHLDAPIHFAEGKNTVDKVPIKQLVNEAIKIDVSQKALSNKDYQISIEDIANWEATNGQIPDQAIVLLQTGFGQYWPDRLKYMGTDKRGVEGVAELHFPGLDPKAADWLIKNRKLSAIGLDTASIDYGQSQTFDSHVILLGQNIPIFENVANLDKLPAKDFEITALPMKIKNGSGGPLRIVAFVHKK